jgi:hypothetical protein
VRECCSCFVHNNFMFPRKYIYMPITNHAHLEEDEPQHFWEWCWRDSQSIGGCSLHMH